MSVGRDGASDAVSFLSVGVPAVEFGPVGDGHHGPEEWVSVASLRSYRQALEGFVERVPGDGARDDARWPRPKGKGTGKPSTPKASPPRRRQRRGRRRRSAEEPTSRRDEEYELGDDFLADLDGEDEDARGARSSSRGRRARGRPRTSRGRRGARGRRSRRRGRGRARGRSSTPRPRSDDEPEDEPRSDVEPSRGRRGRRRGRRRAITSRLRRRSATSRSPRGFTAGRQHVRFPLWAQVPDRVVRDRRSRSAPRPRPA